MSAELLITNLTNPALLFFVLGLLAVQLKSDLEIPANSSKFISLYLLFSIGFKGGQELAHVPFSPDLFWTIVLGVLIACAIPLYTFFILKRRFSVENAGAIAAAYGSVSAVTFVTADSFLEIQGISYGGHMVAIMAMMEAPAIIIGVLLIRLNIGREPGSFSMKKLCTHAVTNGSVLLILGSLAIGWLASEEQANGIKPFTTDIFKGFLAIFLLDMGIVSGRKMSEFRKGGMFALAFAVLIPLLNGVVIALLSGLIVADPGDRFMLSVLGASASYIAVPAAMKIAVPRANPGLFLPMTLAITFPVNITLGMPLYLMLSK